MILKIIAYGIARDILGSKSIEYEVENDINATTLLSELQKDYPDFAELKSLLLAINSEYARPEQHIHETDEIVLIPPVSGG